eukprot:TRINITY_DN24399_c0_g1_i1.p1 TRINITY_DN24399_c0_g1~~TRINITY_DN24399_c0_g1_i1.p1  ORF type:complete len:165 (+),score=67.36 TRINITY_DN24399_c0_g1_i1:139-633(+)
MMEKLRAELEERKFLEGQQDEAFLELRRRLAAAQEQLAQAYEERNQVAEQFELRSEELERLETVFRGLADKEALRRLTENQSPTESLTRKNELQQSEEFYVEEEEGMQDSEEDERNAERGNPFVNLINEVQTAAERFDDEIDNLLNIKPVVLDQKTLEQLKEGL